MGAPDRHASLVLDNKIGEDAQQHHETDKAHNDEDRPQEFAHDSISEK